MECKLNKKLLIVKLIGRSIPTDPGPWQSRRNGKEFEKWSRKYKKLTDYIQAVFLPFHKTAAGMRSPNLIEDELRVLKKTFIGQHILHTIHNALSFPNISHDWRKAIQLLRHEHSRKRTCLFQDDNLSEEKIHRREEENAVDVLCAAQMKQLVGQKCTTRMDQHIEDVIKQHRNFFS